MIAAALIVLEPKFDWTPEKNLLLWYNYKHKRKYIILWKTY